MDDHAMVEEIRSLRGDIDAMSGKLLALRYQDFKEEFLEQMRMALSDEGRLLFTTDLNNLETASQCRMKQVCLGQMQNLITDVTRLLEEDQLMEARRRLDAAEHLILGDSSPCQDNTCAETGLETIGKVKLLLALYSGLAGRFSSLKAELMELGSRRDEIPLPSQVEGVLAPLANQHRITILFMLRQEEHTLADIGRRLDMKAGHLQFHVRSLKEAGYIYRDKRRRTYGITLKGTQALHALGKMLEQLQ